MLEGFTRQETIVLTGTTSSRLAYLDRSNLVVPQKYGNLKKPTVIYAWEQVLEIRAISDLRQKISLQTVRKILEFLEQSGFSDGLRDKHLVTVNDEVYWVLPDWSDMPNVMQVVGKKNRSSGQLILVVILSLANVINDVWKAAEKSEVVDFQTFKQRAKAPPFQENSSRAV